jgi:molybdopterin/thiamine biosynthesis adenylyltransferase
MTLKYGIRITEEDFEKTHTILMADIPNESAAFLLAGMKYGDGCNELIVRRLIEIPKSEYRFQEDYRLEISPRAINGLIGLCEKNGLGVILCHSHPAGIRYSVSDDFGEKRIAQTLWQFLPDVPLGSILISPDGIRGRIWKSDGTAKPISKITVLGRHLRRISLNDNGIGFTDPVDSINNDIFDRQILAFGTEGQSIISKTKVGIVGLGGTGSPTAEQLVRIGVKDFVLIDKDDFDPSNLTRVYGSIYKDAYSKWHKIFHLEKKKVDLIYKHLKRINPAVRILKIKDNVVVKNACKALLGCDVIFCCTDDHWGRSIVNQIAYQYLIPVINMGLRIDSDKGKIRGATGAIHILQSGKPCLWCYELLRAERIRAESLPTHEREVLLREGYVEDISGSAPSVVSLTTAISGLAVTLFLQLLTDFMGEAGDLSCIQYNIMTQEVRRGKTNIKQKCICQAAKGYGDLKSLPIL